MANFWQSGPPGHTYSPKLLALTKAVVWNQEGYGNWERYEGPQTVGLQAVSGFPGQPAFIAGCNFHRRRSRRESNLNIAHRTTIVNRLYCDICLNSIDSRKFGNQLSKRLIAHIPCAFKGVVQIGEHKMSEEQKRAGDRH